MTAAEQLCILKKGEFANFVCPELCKQLHIAGISTNRSLFYWVVCQGKYIVRTNLYDPDGYYTEGNQAVNTINNANVFEAFTIADMDAALPPYLLDRNSFNEYSIMLDQDYPIEEQVSAYRSADAMAIMLLRLVSKRIVAITTINQKLNLIR